MSDSVRNRYSPDEVSPPGDTLREILHERGLTQAELATRTGRPKKTISEIVNGKAAITVDTALRFELVMGVPAAFWNTREQHYREHLARRAQEDGLARHVSWLSKFPVAEMVSRGLLRRKASKPERVRELLAFLGVSSPERWSELVALQNVVFRKSTAFAVDEGSLAVWLRQGLIEAERVPSQPYDREAFKAALREARTLTREAPAVFEDKLVAACARAGVIVSFVPEFKGCRASGATRWIAPDKALIQLSLRYRTDDHLWFTFFHEAAHILLHGKKLIFIEGHRHEGEQEAEANRWAANALIPKPEFERLRRMRPYSKARIRVFARECGVSPGIVVGRLQHEGLLPHSHCNDLKRRFRWAHEPDTGRSRQQ
ncbi:MAG: helix-turn-helix domain-containing protein [Gemmatimonadota bacterium]|uniref:helix-turn-helix domain-containing protein n=1 Tax=Candidatus Palauibacter scopulicola TaxID=3056741 RepID=UPI002396FCA9|nr:helix-turn-helix domain-containing protein [Candidatus Palauibacter scopulicola]MDE2662353.1 helix-turn-helix domain-containing protein [Candidatus Palauibacter scopulicola]